MINLNNSSSSLLKTVALVGLCFSLASCSVYGPPKNDPKVDAAVENMSGCEKLDALLAEYNNHFERIRIKKTNSQFGDIWQARYHLAGQNCQIYRWGNHYSYTCNISSPSKETSLSRLAMATEKIEACLDESWAKTSTTLTLEQHNKEGVVTTYSSPDFTPIISTQAFKSSGVLKKEWLNYIFIGDKKQISE